MKQRTFRSILLRSIRGGLSRFLAIFAIVALGCGFLVGLFSTGPDMRETADAYYKEYRTMDMDVKGTLGLTEADLDALRSLPEVSSVTGAYSLDLLLADPNGDEVTVRTLGIPGDPEASVNGYVLTEGRYPERPGECVLEMPNSYVGGYACGDVFTVPEGSGSFRVDTFTVVGLAHSPLYMSIESEPTNVGTGSIGVFLYLLPETFDLSVYTDAFVTFGETENISCFSDTYKELLSEYRTVLETVGKTQSERRANEVRAQIDQTLADAREELKKAQTDWENKKISSEAALNALYIDILQTERTLRFLQARGGNGSLLQTLHMRLEEQKTSYARLNFRFTTEKALTERALAQADAQLRLAERETQTVAEAEWILFDRTENAGFSSFSSNADKITSISKIFPVFFCLVAALVATTTMTRMVEEDRVQAGTLGALGYGSGSILSYYLLYCLCASVPGCIFGVWVGSKLFPSVIWNAYRMMYNLPDVAMPVRFGYAAVTLVLVCGAILFSTYLVCRSQTKEMPASLMRPRAPAAGKRIFLERIPAVWKKLSFRKKVTARNLFRYKKRLLMTVIGVAGCTALLLTGFGLQDSIATVVDRQYDTVQTYQLSVLLRDGNKKDEPVSALEQTEGIDGVLPVFSETVALQYENERFSLTLWVPEEMDPLPDFLSLHTAKDQTPLSAERGLVLTENAARILGVSVGDTLRLTVGNGKTASVKVDGICENYISNFAVLSKERYRELFESDPIPSGLFVRLREDTPEVRASLAKQLYQYENVRYVHFNGEVRERFDNTIEKLNFVVYVLIFSAAALAMIVLYSLNTINICERKRELATMKVLGFYENEVRSYVFRESILLTLIGIVFGWVLGVFLHAFVIRTVEMDILMFVHRIRPTSYLLAAATTLLFAVLVSILSVPSIRKINMVDSLKANE